MSKAETFDKLSEAECREIVENRRIHNDQAFRVLNTIKSLQRYQDIKEKYPEDEFIQDLESAHKFNATPYCRKQEHAIVNMITDILEPDTKVDVPVWDASPQPEKSISDKFTISLRQVDANIHFLRHPHEINVLDMQQMLKDLKKTNIYYALQAKIDNPYPRIDTLLWLDLSELENSFEARKWLVLSILEQEKIEIEINKRPTFVEDVTYEVHESIRWIMWWSIDPNATYKKKERKEEKKIHTKNNPKTAVA